MTSKIGVKLLVFFTFFINFFCDNIIKEHNLLPYYTFGPFTYVSCENCISGFFVVVLNLSKSGNILFRSMPNGNCLFGSTSIVIGFFHVPSAALRLALSVFSNERCSGGSHTKHVLLISDLQFWSFKFSNFFIPAETLILGCFWLDFRPELLKLLSILFENMNSNDMQGDASDLLRFLFKY